MYKHSDETKEIVKYEILKEARKQKKKEEVKKRKQATSDKIQKRLNDVRIVKYGYGYIAELSRKWNVSHTQVRRFLKDHDFGRA